MVGQKGFEEEGGGYLVDKVLAIEAVGGSLALAVAVVEELVGFVGGEALVEQMVGEGGVLRKELGGEGLSLFGLGTGRTVGVQGEADDESVHLLLADEAAYRF